VQCSDQWCTVSLGHSGSPIRDIYIDHQGTDDQCPDDQCSPHQCHLTLPISAHQCHISVPTSAHQCHISVLI
ncbi:unnamed protein product, partial [Staurois parvus]